MNYQQYDLLIRIIYSLCSLYMVLILVRWFAGYLEIDLYSPRLRWIDAVTEPLLRIVRRLLPHMGPMDISPLVAILVVWLARTIIVTILSPRVGAF